MKKSTLLILILSLFALCLFSCSTREEYRVEFFVDGELYYTCYSKGSESITLPEEPSISGKNFEGWYIGYNYSEPFSEDSFLNTPITQNIVIFAKLVEEEHIHSFSNQTVNPTCTEAGYTRYYCECSFFYEEYIEPIGHDYMPSVVLPSCEEKGYTIYSCAACGNSYKTDYTEEKGHNYKSEIKEPTCTESGYTIYICSECEYSYTDDFTGPKNHTYTQIVVNPTCTEMGYTEYICSCTYSYKADYIPPLSHEYREVITPPTLTEPGYKTYTCHCGDSYTEIYADPIKHNYQPTIISPTCTESGYTLYTCTDCAHSYKADHTAAKGHSFMKMSFWPTCTSVGYTAYTCLICNYSYNDNYTDPKPHEFLSIVTPPTCTERGYTTYICSGCGISYEGDFVDKLSHSYEIKITEPTCTEGGYTTYTCSLCSHSYKGDYKEPAAHNYRESVVLPTCKDMGYTEYECIYCSDGYRGNYITELGHNMQIFHDSEKHRKECTRCSYIALEEEHYQNPNGCGYCGYVYPEGTIFYGGYVDVDGYFAMSYKKAESGELLDLYIPAVHNGKQVTVHLANILNANSDDIRSLTIETGAKVYDCRIEGCDNLEELIIYGSVSSDDYFRLSDCSKLKKLVYPRGASKLGDIDCKNLSELSVPATVKNFRNDYAVEKIGVFNYEGSLEEWLSFDGNKISIMQKAENFLLCGEEIKELIIPAGIYHIPDYAFNGVKTIESVTIPADVSSIGKRAFGDCINIEKAYISAEDIGIAAFAGCTRLSDLTLTAQIKTIQGSAFSNCISLESIILPSGVETVGANLFSGCDKLLYAYIPSSIKKVSSQADGVTYLGTPPVFSSKSCVVILSEASEENSPANMMNLSSFYLPFSGYDTASFGVESRFLTYYGKTPSDVFLSGDFLFVKGTGKTAEIVRYMGNEKSVTLPETVDFGTERYTVTALREYSFLKKDIEELHIPKTITYLTSMLGTDSINEIAVDPESHKYTVVDGVLFTKDMQTLMLYPSGKAGDSYSIPESVTNILTFAFSKTQLKYVYAPSSEAINYFSFVGSNNLPVVATDNHEKYDSGFNILSYNPSCIFVKTESEACENVIVLDDRVYLVNGSEAALVSYTGSEIKPTLRAIISHAGKEYRVVSVFYEAFANNQYIEEVVFEEGFFMIGRDSRFSDEHPEGFPFDESFYTNSNKSLFVFSNCPSLKKIVLPSSVKIVSGLAMRCDSLSHIDFGGVEYISDAVQRCSSLSSAVLPPTIKRMAFYTFHECSSLRELTVGSFGMSAPNQEAEAVISEYAVEECPIEILRLGDQVKTAKSFSISFADTVKEFHLGMGDYENDLFSYIPVMKFYYYGSFEELVGSNIRGQFLSIYIGGERFGEELIVDESNAGRIGYLFEYNNDITRVIIRCDGLSVNSLFFSHAENIKTIVVEAEGVILDFYSFPYAEQLVIIGSVDTIRESFNHPLKRIYLTDFGKWVNIEFYQTYNLINDKTDFYIIGSDEPCCEINLPETVSAINAYAFCGLDYSRYTINIHSGIKYISAYAFGEHSTLAVEDIEGWYFSSENDPGAVIAWNEKEWSSPADFMGRNPEYCWFKLG